MDVTSAIRQMVESTGKSKKQISGEIGMRREYVNQFLSKGTMPKVNTFARIADACGYDLILLPRNQDAEFIVIDADEMQP